MNLAAGTANVNAAPAAGVFTVTTTREDHHRLGIRVRGSALGYQATIRVDDSSTDTAHRAAAAALIAKLADLYPGVTLTVGDRLRTSPSEALRVYSVDAHPLPAEARSS